MTELKRELGIFSCTMLVAGNMIGIGIFVTAGRITTHLPNPSWILLAWIFGGFLSLAGALSYAELSSRFPRAGGGYVFLREAFGPFMGFLAGFSASMVTIPGTAAFLAVGVTKYAGILDPVTARTVAVTLILAISLVNYWGVKWGAELQDGFMVLKLFLIFILIAAGFLSGKGSMENFKIAQPLSQSLWVAFPLAMVPVMYTYSGWDATVYVAGEVKNPSKTIPISLFFGTLLVASTYLLLASLYLYALPVTASENQVKIVTAAGKVFFGDTIGNVIGWIVSFSVLGCLSATILTGPRVIYAMAKDKLFPNATGEIHPLFATPGKAIWFHGIWASFLAVTGTFDRLLDYVTVPSIFFATLAVIGLFVLRKKDHYDPGIRPYLSFGYPIFPILFIAGMGWIIYSTVLNNAKDSLWGMGIVSLGIPIYIIRTMKRVFHKPYSVAPENELAALSPHLTRDPQKIYKAKASALHALQQLFYKAERDNVRIVVISSHRTFDFQRNYFEEAEKRHGKGKGALWVAPAGFSEHHTGFVFDLADKDRPETDDEPAFETTKASAWLKQNARSFGFELSFPPGNWQGVSYEPWHWRFAGDAESKNLFHPPFSKNLQVFIKSIVSAF